MGVSKIGVDDALIVTDFFGAALADEFAEVQYSQAIAQAHNQRYVVLDE